MSGFNETMILECNRLASEEGKTGNIENPALFTNKIQKSQEFTFSSLLNLKLSI